MATVFDNPARLASAEKPSLEERLCVSLKRSAVELL
jgi:hypothetical protein